MSNGVSPDAAAAAAHFVLVQLYPAQQAMLELDATYVASLSGIPEESKWSRFPLILFSTGMSSHETRRLLRPSTRRSNPAIWQSFMRQCSGLGHGETILPD
jgi:hypothetical protein